MASLSSGSVSKGVFVFKGKKNAANVEDYFGDGVDVEAERDRMIICNELWEQIDQDIQVMQSNLNTKIFEDLLRFVDSAYKGFTPGSNHGAKALQEIPTAALVTGVNMPDHAVMFGNLMSLLRERVSPLLAVLRSKDCQNVKTVMTNTLSQLMDSTDVLDEDDAEDDTGDHINLRRVNATMGVLAAWYRDTAQKCASPPKRRVDGSPVKRRSPSKRAPYPPVVIVLEDLESFIPAVLQDFIAICSKHLQEVPLVLVFGIATTVTAVHRLLPQSVSSLLCMEKFQAPPSTEYLSQVIDKVVMTPGVPFKIGGKVFNLLMDIFLYHDFSVLNFIRGMQFALLDHFYSNPSSILCVTLNDLEEQTDQLSHHQLEQIRANMSFRRYVESRPPQERISLLEDDAYTWEVIQKLSAMLDLYHRCFFPVLTCLHTFTHKLPGSPLGTKIRQLYGSSLSSCLCDCQAYTDAMALVRALSRDEIVAKLQQCSELLSAKDIPQDLGKVKVKIEELKDKFENIEELSREYEEQHKEENNEETETAPDLPKKTDMYTLRQTLQEREKKSKKLSLYEILRNDTVEYLDSTFKKYLVCPTKLPLHEVFYYNSAATLKRHMNGSPRGTIQNGLANPYYYLQHDDLRAEGLSISPCLPDLCIVYKLHAECGRLINLYDWLQAFVTIVTATDENEENVADQKKPDKLLQARFIRAVSELQFLGFVKPTKRKTDHVARLTWGGC